MKKHKNEQGFLWIAVILCLTIPLQSAETFAAPILSAETGEIGAMLEDAGIRWIAPVTGFDWEAREKPEQQEMKEIQGTQGMPEMHGLQELPKIQEMQEVRELQEPQERPEMQRTQEIRELSEMPEMQEPQEISEMQELQEMPEMQELQEISEMQELQEMPEIQKISEITLDDVRDFDSLVRQFYVIDSTTMADARLLDPERFLSKDLSVSKDGDGPQILIYHTHSQEAFSDSVQGDPDQTVTGVGERLACILREDYGYQVLHHIGIYDKPSRNGAYSRALPEIQRILDENPSIQVVIDLHRDEMPKNVHLITEIDGKKTARFMFFNGISRTRKTGELDYLKNEFLEDNLAFSFQMEKAAQEYYPGLTRKIYLKGYRYNMHLCPNALLIELGAQNNTLEEAMNACEPLAKILDLVLSGRAG